MKQLRQMKRSTRNSWFTYALVVAAFVIVQLLRAFKEGGIGAMLEGQLIPICAYITMAVSLNLVVGISGELSLGHAGFMSLGAFAGSAFAIALEGTVALLSPASGPGHGIRRPGGGGPGLPHRHPGATPERRLPGHCHAGLWRDHQEHCHQRLSGRGRQRPALQLPQRHQRAGGGRRGADPGPHGRHELPAHLHLRGGLHSGDGGPHRGL